MTVQKYDYDAAYCLGMLNKHWLIDDRLLNQQSVIALNIE